MTTPFSIAFVAFFGRTYDEYLQMFSLRPESLKGLRILDCPSGPDGFVADAAARGLQVTGCDPLYGLQPDALHARAASDIEECFSKLARSGQNFDFGDPQKYRQDKFDALERFMKDYRMNGSRYIHAALPDLPFANRSFDLVLSSHFLFCYADVEHGGMMDGGTVDLDFHLRSIDALARVAGREIRMTPTHAMQQPPRRHPYIEPAMKHLESLGFAATLEPSDYPDGFAPFVEVLVARRR